MLPQALLVALGVVASTAAASAVDTQPLTPRDFLNPGQIRTLYIHDDHPDLGCLTALGQWTVDESQCGTFIGSWNTNLSYYLSAPATGGCGIDLSTFKCGRDGVEPSAFGIFGWPGTGDGPVPGRDVLRDGEYGIFATAAANSPPAPGEAPLDIHFYDGSENGKWVWLGWKDLPNHE